MRWRPLSAAAGRGVWAGKGLPARTQHGAFVRTGQSAVSCFTPLACSGLVCEQLGELGKLPAYGCLHPVARSREGESEKESVSTIGGALVRSSLVKPVRRVLNVADKPSVASRDVVLGQS